MEYDAIEFASYADDTTPYNYGQSLDEITSCINKGFQIHKLTKRPDSHEVVYHFTV